LLPLPLLFDLEVVNINCVVLELFAKHADLGLKLLLFIDVLVDLGGKSFPLLLQSYEEG
jgi:hypothetical protein